VRAARPRPITLRPIWRTELTDHTIAVAWQPGGSLLAAAALDGPITLFQGEDGRTQHDLAGHQLGTSALHWAPDGRRLASAGQDGNIRLWDPSSGEQVTAVKAGAQWVEHVAWSPDGQLLAGAAGRIVRIWDREGALVREYPAQSATVSALTWEPETRALTIAARGQISILDPEKDAPIYEIGWQSTTLALAWSPDGSFLAAGGDDGYLHLWMMRTIQEIDFSGYDTRLREMAWSRDSALLATGGGPTVVVWDCSGEGPRDRRPTRCRWHRPTVRALAFQREGCLLASGGADARLALWRIDPYERLALARLDSGLTRLDWSTGDRWLAAGTEAGGLAVFAIPDRLAESALADRPAAM
jgi:WD40 repeat protein